VRILTNFEEEREVSLSLVSNYPYWDVVEVAVVNNALEGSFLFLSKMRQIKYIFAFYIKKNSANVLGLLENF